jgi:twinkle protein
MSNIIQQHIQCPSCPSTDAYCLYDDGHGYCFSCQYYCPPNKKNFEEEIFTYEYTPHRGLLRNTLEFYDIKTKIDGNGRPVSVGFKYPNLSFKVRDLSDKQFRWEGPSVPSLFGRDKFSSGSHKYITITEGEYDAASLYQVLGSPVVSIRSSSSAVADLVHERSWLNQFEFIIIAFDGDAAGREATRNVAKLFDYAKVLVVNFDKYKDANEYLQNGEADELKTIWKNAKKYLPETVISSFAEFKRILGDTPVLGQLYPFAGVNDKTYGIRRGESVLITAQEGVGKTEICHAILHKILKETDDAVGAIFLEEPKAHLLRALAGIELKSPTHLPECGHTTADIFTAVQGLCRNDDRLHIYSNFGSDDPDVLIDTIRFMVAARNVVYVCLDHISMVVSGLTLEDERRKLDYLCTRLEMLVKELNFSLIFVSHVNDAGQTRGSRYISKICDIRIDATRDLLNENESIRNTTVLTVSKNRYCGKTGSAGNYLFNQNTRQYTQVLEAANDNEYFLDKLQAA